MFTPTYLKLASSLEIDFHTILKHMKSVNAWKCLEKLNHKPKVF